MRFWLFVALAACTHDTASHCDHGEDLRDPETGICQFVDTCTVARPDWASCQTACDGLTATQCLATAGCHAAYVDSGSDQGPTFWQCWDVPPSGPAEGNCAGLDAQECSRYDDCTSIYNPGAPSTGTMPAVATSFQGCAPAIPGG